MSCQAARDTASASGIEPWKRAYCTAFKNTIQVQDKRDSQRVFNRFVKTTDEECEAIIQAREAECVQYDNDPRSEKFKKMDFQGCVKYRESVSTIITELQTTVSNNLGQAAHACEEAMFLVCKNTLCPTWLALSEEPQADCDTLCSDAGSNLWAPKVWDCESMEDWNECIDSHWDSEGKQVKFAEVPESNTAIVALMREQLLKCICVSRTKNNNFCYTDNPSNRVKLQRGEKWCQYDRTSKWKTLKEADQEKYQQLFQPECDEFPFQIEE